MATLRAALDVGLQRGHAEADLAIYQEVDFIRKEVSVMHEEAYDG